MMMKKKMALYFMAGTILSGCSTFSEESKESLATKKIVEDVNTAVRKGGLTLTQQRHDINVDEGIWVSTETELVAEMLPPHLVNARLNIVEGDAMNLGQVCSYLTKRFGIKFKRANELIKKGELSDVDSLSQNVVGASNLTPTTTTTTAAAPVQSNKRLDYVPVGDYRFALEDVTFEEMLDNVAESLGVSWKYDSKVGVQFYFYETDYLVIENSPLERSFNATSTNKSGISTSGEGGSSETNQTLNVDLAGDFWAEQEKSLEGLISPFGQVDVNRRTGSVIVTDSPDMIAEVEQYINYVNNMMDLEAETKLTIVRFTQDSSSDLTFTIDAVYEKVDRMIASGLSPTRGGAEALSSIGLSVTDPTSRWNGSQLFLDALASEGNVTVMREKEAPIKNYTMFQWKKGANFKYFESITNTDTASVGSSQTAEISEEFLGIGISLHPRIRNKSKITYDIIVSQNDLVALQETTIGDTETTLPQTTGEDVTALVDIKNGQSKVILKYTTSKSERENSGPISPGNCYGGCNRSSSEENEYILYILTASVK